MPVFRVLVDGKPLEEFPPEQVIAIRRRLSREVNAAVQHWLDNHFQQIYEETLREVRQGR